jgi:hypothetical protein
MVRWPLLELKVVVPSGDRYYNVEDLERSNGGTFKDWGLRGFSLGNYHEFFCIPLPIHAGFKMSGAEATFGYATPLAACLYNGYHDHHYFDPWDNLTTARILGTPRENAEAIFINAALAYKQRFKILPELMRLDLPDSLFDEEADSPAPQVFVVPPAVADVEPLRFHYSGLGQFDPIAACIYFYRVLEYFSFWSHQREISRLRHDDGLCDGEFTKRILEIAFKEERGPVLRLINDLADDSILSAAVGAGLIKAKDAGQLGAELYAFRNSIVHGKLAAGYALEASSVLSESNTALAWRKTLQLLAERALQTRGKKLLG